VLALGDPVELDSPGDTLYVQYRAASAFAGNNRIWSSPLILSVDKGSYTKVVFIFGNRKYGTATIAKNKDKEK
jgi:hypothetical protein